MTPDIRPLSDFDADRRRLESAFSDVLRSVLDRLEAPQVYILSDAEVGIACPSTTGGFVSECIDLAAEVAVCDRWRGVAPTIVVSADAIQATAETFDAVTLASIVAHEAAHIACRERMPSRSYSPETQRLLLDGIQTDISEPEPPDASEDACRDHGIQFTRALCHIVARVHSEPDDSITINSEIAFPNAHYGLGHLSGFMLAVADEARLYADVPLDAVLRRIPPVRFSDRFYLDIEAGDYRR